MTLNYLACGPTVTPHWVIQFLSSPFRRAKGMTRKDFESHLALAVTVRPFPSGNVQDWKSRLPLAVREIGLPVIELTAVNGWANHRSPIRQNRYILPSGHSFPACYLRQSSPIYHFQNRVDSASWAVRKQPKYHLRWFIRRQRMLPRQARFLKWSRKSCLAAVYHSLVGRTSTGAWFFGDHHPSYTVSGRGFDLSVFAWEPTTWRTSWIDE